MGASSCVVIGLNVSSDAGCECCTPGIVSVLTLNINQGHRLLLSVQL